MHEKRWNMRGRSKMSKCIGALDDLVILSAKHRRSMLWQRGVCMQVFLTLPPRALHFWKFTSMRTRPLQDTVHDPRSSSPATTIFPSNFPPFGDTPPFITSIRLASKFKSQEKEKKIQINSCYWTLCLSTAVGSSSGSSS